MTDLPIGELLLALIVWAGLRGGKRWSAPATASLRFMAGAAALTGGLLTVAPVLGLAADLSTARSAVELLALLGFLALAMLLVLALWFLLLVKLRTPTTRSTAAFVLAMSISGGIIAARHYSGFLAGDSDSQNGILVFLVALYQVVNALLASRLRAFVERGATVTGATGSVGHT
jgi:hypothetical protein